MKITIRRPKKGNSKVLSRAFAALSEGRYTKPLYRVFIDECKDVPSDLKTNEYKKLISSYEKIIEDTKFIDTLNTLSTIEIKLMMHIASMNPEVTLGEMKLNRNGNEISYLFGRTALYSPNKIKNEVRIYLGRMSDFNGTLEELKGDKKFIDEVKKLFSDDIKMRIQEMNY
jgi:hypothetical protein